MITRRRILAPNRILLLFLAIALAGAGRAQAPSAKEYEIKALFLFHFAMFVTWPPTAFHDDRSPLVIGIVGEDPFGHFLDEVIAGETAQGHPLVVARFARPQDVGFCHILYVSPGVDGRLGEIRARLSQQPVLTVGETDDFVRRGGVVRFLTRNSRTHLQINVAAAKHVGLVISSKLLRAASVIAPEGVDP